MKKRVYLKKLTLFAMSAAMIIAALGFASPAKNIRTKNKNKILKIGTLDNLKQLMDKSNSIKGYMRNDIMYDSDFEMKTTMSAASNGAVANGTPYSSTNVQTAGVDEGDIVKTDGEYIYYVNDTGISIIKAYPAKSMAVEGKINFDDNKFRPEEIYTEGNYMAIIGEYSYEVRTFGGLKSPIRKILPEYRYNWTSTRVYIYDISKKSLPKKLKEVEYDGRNLATRKIGSRLYVITNKDINYYYLKDYLKYANSGIVNDILPSYTDSSAGKNKNIIPPSRIGYFPGYLEPTFTTIGVTSMTDMKEGTKVTSYMGGGENIYMSDKNLYVAVKDYPDKSKYDLRTSYFRNTDTLIFRFNIVPEGVKEDCAGQIPGEILNQFSMDESGSYFRVASTQGNIYDKGDNISKSNLYILDSGMNIKGSLTNLAPGEKIYSVRFMGSRAYIVTFKKVDPLFVIDLSSPENPKVLGKLKIPGFSDYIHPYDQNHIIGFGKETVELSSSMTGGNSSDTNAYYLGMKTALFDVTDVNNPKEESKIIIGDRGTNSELLYNHKALMFSKEKGVMAFPVELYELKDSQKTINSNGDYVYPEYGSFSYQGAYIFDVSADKGITLRGRITHMTDDDYMRLGESWYDNGASIKRIIYIGDTLYTLSDNMIKANSLSDLKEIGSLKLK